ncbi:MAG TPA: bile acid:sodium symporter family protein [Chitinophagaceae bacterium]|nr:bile acid:sodium symporter family protein [Chitinophagaceae bacterium]
MDSSPLMSILLPLALGIIMFGLGLTLSIGDFSRIFTYPKAVIIGLACQMLLLPAACFGLAKLFNLSPELAVGLILLAASPGGVTSNFYSHLAKGDVVLNITLNAASSLLCIFTLPLIVNFAMLTYMDESKYIALQFFKVLQIFAIILLPVALGMFFRKKDQALSLRMQKPVKIFSILFLVGLIIMQVVKERGNLGHYWQQIGLAALSFNLLSLTAGFFIPYFFKLPKKQSIAICMGVSIHNCALAITIALSPSLLNNSVMSIPPAIYSIVMYFTATLFGYVLAKQRVGIS